MKRSKHRFIDSEVRSELQPDFTTKETMEKSKTIGKIRGSSWRDVNIDLSIMKRVLNFIWDDYERTFNKTHNLSWSDLNINHNKVHSKLPSNFTAKKTIEKIQNKRQIHGSSWRNVNIGLSIMKRVPIFHLSWLRKKRLTKPVVHQGEF